MSDDTSENAPTADDIDIEKLIRDEQIPDEIARMLKGEIPDDTAQHLRDIQSRLNEIEDNTIWASTTSIVRPAFPEDADTIAALTVAAFTQSEYGHNGEAELINQIQTNCAIHISLVHVTIGSSEVEDGDVHGHILFSRAHIKTADSRIAGMALAPMAVHPDYQRSGIGSHMVEQGLHQLDTAGCPFVVVIGHPDYYPRFGFKTAAEYNITHGFDGIPQEVFFIRWNEETKLPAMNGGKAWFNEAFGAQHSQPTQDN